MSPSKVSSDQLEILVSVRVYTLTARLTLAPGEPGRRTIRGDTSQQSVRSVSYTSKSILIVPPVYIPFSANSTVGPYRPAGLSDMHRSPVCGG